METLGLTRFYLHMPIASMPHEDIMHAIEIYGNEVVPKVKQYFNEKENNEKQNKKFSFKWKNIKTPFGKDI